MYMDSFYLLRVVKFFLTKNPRTCLSSFLFLSLKILVRSQCNSSWSESGDFIHHCARDSI